jgi:hypothetical protein
MQVNYRVSRVALVMSFARFIFLFMLTARPEALALPGRGFTGVGRTVHGEPRSMEKKMDRPERLTRVADTLARKTTDARGGPRMRM